MPPVAAGWSPCRQAGRNPAKLEYTGSVTEGKTEVPIKAVPDIAIQGKILAIAVGFVIAWAGAPVQASVISGTYDGNSVLTPTGTAGVFGQSFSGTGNDTTFGSFDLVDQSTLDLSNLPGTVVTDVTYTITFPGGTLFGSGSGSGTATGPNTATTTLALTIAGGSGSFVGDIGEVTATETDTFTGPTTLSVTDGSYSGTLIESPEPNTSPMLVLALGLIWVVARHRSSC